MEKPKMTEVVTTLVDALTPFDSGERKRIVRAALTILEEDSVEVTPQAKNSNAGAVESPAAETENVHVTAQRWMKQNNLKREELDHVFQIEKGSVEVLRVNLPGKNKKENTQSAYILAGVAAFIATGEPIVDDKVARKLSNDLGCYDGSNHATNVADIGNVLNGSKTTGYKLTAPGLSAGAALIKKLVPATG